MKDKMFPCLQRPNTKEYEDNYDRIFGKVKIKYEPPLEHFDYKKPEMFGKLKEK